MVTYWRRSDDPIVVGTGNVLGGTLSTGGNDATDGNNIRQAGWVLDRYRTNGILTWCHDTSSPPIGRNLEISVRNDMLCGTFLMAETEFASTIADLVKQRVINCFSVSWIPIEWKHATEKGRKPGAIDFIRQELLECALVSLPADPSCLITARSAGTNTAPLAAWAERALDKKLKLPIPRTQLEALYKHARMPTPRSGAGIRTTLGEREARLRKAAFDGFALGCDIPPGVWPPQTRAEREAVAAGMLARAKAERPL